MKFALIFVNTVSVYYTLWHYAKFFSVSHPRVVENSKALDAVRQVIGRNHPEKRERERDGEAVSSLVDAAQPMGTAVRHG